jgi:hypothetical protein
MNAILDDLRISETTELQAKLTAAQCRLPTKPDQLTLDKLEGAFNALDKLERPFSMQAWSFELVSTIGFIRLATSEATFDSHRLQRAVVKVAETAQEILDWLETNCIRSQNGSMEFKPADGPVAEAQREITGGKLMTELQIAGNELSALRLNA